MLRLLFVLLSIGYAESQYAWQYGNYPRYDYAGSRQLGFGYYNSAVASPTQQVQTPPRQTIANYYQPGSLLNPATMARSLSPTNVKVVDYNELKAAQARSTNPLSTTGQIASYAVSRNQIATLNAQHNLAVTNKQPISPFQRQVPHPAFQTPNQQQINRLIQQKQRQQKELQLQQAHQQKMLQHVQNSLISDQKPRVTEKPPMFNYPIQGFQLLEKTKPKFANSPKIPMFQKMGQSFGSSYLSSGAGRVEELRGSLGGEKPIMNWIQARTG